MTLSLQPCLHGSCTLLVLATVADEDRGHGSRSGCRADGWLRAGPPTCSDVEAGVASESKSQLGSWTASERPEPDLANLANLAIEFVLDRNRDL